MAEALNEKEREAANPHVQVREDKPKDVYLLPEEEKYPVRVKKDGAWHYDKRLLEAAAAEARMHGHEDLAKRADEIREHEFGSHEEGEDISSVGARRSTRTLRAHGPDGARDSLVSALRGRFSTPRDAIVKLGLDSALLTGNSEVKMAHLSHGSAGRLVEALRAGGKLALDADVGEITNLLEQIEGLEGADRRVADTAAATGGNAGVPPWLAEHQEDADPEFESEEERCEDEAADRRAEDMRRRLGRDASDEEWERQEEELEFKPDTSEALDRMRAEDRRQAEDRRRRAEDRKRVRADDARRRLGRDENEVERSERERREEGEDRRGARDRARMGRDYRRARDGHRRALDALRRHADDYRRAEDARRTAEDGRREAEDGKRADDAARCGEDARRAADAMRRAAEDARRAHDEVCAACDARRGARDRRRAHDRRVGRDEPPEFRGMPKTGGEMVSKAAMDAAIQERISAALRDNDTRHHAIAEAVEAVRPKTGRIAMDGIASEADVWSRALDVLGVSHAGITQLAALKAMFNMAPRPGGDRRDAPGFAADAAPKAGNFETFKKMFGESAAAIERI